MVLGLNLRPFPNVKLPCMRSFCIKLQFLSYYDLFGSHYNCVKSLFNVLGLGYIPYDPRPAHSFGPPSARQRNAIQFR